MQLTIPPTVKAIFFDLNGTLIRDRAVHHAANDQMFTEYGVRLSEEERENKVANRLNREIWPAILNRQIDPVELSAISIVKERLYVKLLPALGNKVPGMLELLTALKGRGIYLGLVTSAPNDLVEHLLTYLHLEDIFDDIISGQMLNKGKPDPDAYLQALSRSGFNPNEVLVFEDSPQGVQAGVAAGLRVIGVLPDYSEEILRQFGASTVIADFTQITLHSIESIDYLNSIPVKENGEPVINMSTVDCKFTVRECIPTILRQSVYEMLNRVSEQLPTRYRLFLWRGYSSIEEQKNHWDKHIAELKEQYPDWSEEMLISTTSKVYAPYNQLAPPGHSTGGAIDVILVDQNKNPIDVTPPLEDWSLGATRCHLISEEQQKMRTLLCHLMEKEGFSNYPLEYWHYSYGDSAWAARTGNSFAMYDKIIS